MNYVFLVVALTLLIFLYPIRTNIFSEDGIKMRVTIFGFITIPISIQKFVDKFATTHISDQVKFSELIENLKKVRNANEMFDELSTKAKITRLHWYSAVPMENPVLGIYFFGAFNAFQSIILSFLSVHFKKIRNIDIDTKINNVDEDIKIYLDCIIETNFVKIITVAVKYYKHIPILIKRVS
ncbi:hypothetical protein [Haloplasma contractile]|uniref:Uncharacterized protein n=1 Tax=Haloplasma contractile SSD-17B TaxID=1033810 RepID=F7PV49_9MOLU|nr:hypothetical protein [Haloplasma contractile]ERJ10983.1 hypothetical protein HLPCO_002988 [Haloplasma contractile SSD-17B]